MSSNVVVCQVDPELQSQLTSFRSRKEKVASALVMKVDKETQTVVLDELLEDLESLEDCASKSSIRRFVITEKAPTRAFSRLKAATTAFKFKTLY